MMKFRVTRTSDHERAHAFDFYVEDVAHLLSFIRKSGNSAIIHVTTIDGVPELEVYDQPRET